MSEILCQQLGFEVAGQSLLKQVDAQFYPASINVILGQNGAGKSTLLQVIAKAKSVTSGQIQWQGRDLKKMSLAELARKRAVVEQSQPLQFDFSVRQFVSLGLEVQFGSELLEAYRRSTDFEQVLNKLLRTCDLTQFAERSILSLSGGEFKRAQIARAVAQIWPIHANQVDDFTGRWLLLDEWNAALDIGHQQCFASLLRTWAEQGLGVIMAVHDLPLAMQLADSVLLLKDGQRFAHGAAQSVFRQSTLEAGLQMQLQMVTTETGQSIFLPKF